MALGPASSKQSKSIKTIEEKVGELFENLKKTQWEKEKLFKLL